MATEKRRIGEILVERKLITKAVLKEALESQRRTGIGITEYLIASGHIDEGKLAKCLIEQFGFPYLPIRSYDIPDEIIDLVPAEIAKKYCLMPVGRVKDVFTVVMANPLNTAAIKEIERITGYSVQQFVGYIPDILKAIEKYYRVAVDDKKLKIPKIEIDAPLFVETRSYRGFDRRTAVRYKTEIDAHFLEEDQYKKVQIKNLSVSGLLLQSDHNTVINSYMSLKIDLPREISPRPIAVVVQVLRVTPASRKFNIGARIVKIPKADAETIAAFARTNRKS
jgi:hypothetical protein